MADDGPHTNFGYEVRIDDDALGGFTEVSCTGAQSPVVEYREGGLRYVTHTHPRDVSHSNVTLHRGMTVDETLVEWLTGSMSGPREQSRSKVSISMKDRHDETKWTWVLIPAYPVSRHGQELAAEAPRAVRDVTASPSSGSNSPGKGSTPAPGSRVPDRSHSSKGGSW